MLSQRSAVQRAYDEVGDAWSAVPVDGVAEAVADLIDDVGDLAVDVAEVAASTITSSSRLGIRFVTSTVRFVARHPREILAGLVIVTAVAAAVTYLTRRDGESS